MGSFWQTPVFYLTFFPLLITAVAFTFIIYKRFPLHLIYKSKINLESMLDAIGDPLAVIDNTYIVLRANKAYIDLVKSTFSEAIGQHCYLLLRKRNSPCTDCKFTQSIRDQKSQFIPRSHHPSGTGALSINFSPYYDLYEHQCIIEHLRDISTLEELKNDLEKKNKSLAHTMRTLKAAQANIRDELRLAKQIQQGLLPKHAPSFQGLKIAHTYHPVSDVGGDIYDFIPFSSDKLGIFIGDASGHGLSSAFIGTISKMSLYNHGKDEMPTGELLSQINHDLIKNVHTSHYITCFWSIFDLSNNTLTYSRAGHPMPVVLRKNGVVDRLQSSGSFMGILDDAQYEQQVTSIEKGDRIFLFTDGIYEVLDRSGNSNDILGYDTFVQMLTECINVPFGKLISTIQHRLEQFTYEDDYTLIVIEVTGR